MILDRILEGKRREIERLRPSAGELRRGAANADPPRGFGEALRSGSSVSVIAEFKRRSPSAGAFQGASGPDDAARTFAASGAAALSVLTDAPWFGGSAEDLASARAACGLPVLRKDFVIDPLQLEESRALGADAVLLITRALDPATLRTLLNAARDLGMDALVEVHSRVELDAALGAGADIVGVNARDLASFEVDPDFAARLVGEVPAGLTAVAESGVRSRADVERAAAAGADAVLVGGWLMQGDHGARLAELVGVSRAERT